MAGNWRNTGARFTTTDGRKIYKGVTFDPSPEDLARRRHKLEWVGPGDPPTPGVEDDAPANDEVEGTEPPEPEVQDDPMDVEQYHTGYGWYTLPGGVRAHGKEEAEEILNGQG